MCDRLGSGGFKKYGHCWVDIQIITNCVAWIQPVGIDSDSKFLAASQPQ